MALAAAILAFVLVPSRSTRAGTVQPLIPVTEADGKLGLCDVLPGTVPGQSTSWAALAAAAGARTNRWEFRWDRIEPKKGTWDFSRDDPVVASSQAAGLEVEGILIGTPKWAVAKGQKPGNGLPRGFHLPDGDPRNLWAQYVQQTVQHYRGVVRSWEIWNEPDLAFFWSGSPQDYFQLLRTAFFVIRQTDPTARVVMAGMVVPDLAFLRQVLDAARADPGSGPNGDYFDVAAWHVYGPAKNVYPDLLRFRSLLRSEGAASKPVWVTEDGFPASNPNGEPRQASYVLQTVMYALTAGADRVLVYRASDDVGPKHWGILSASGDIRMGYVAFQVAARYLAHARAIIYAPSGGLERFTVYRPNQRVTVLWSAGVARRTLDLPVSHGESTLVDSTGTVSTVSAPRGSVHVVLPGSSYGKGTPQADPVVGGPPMLEIDDNTPIAPAPVQAVVAPVTGQGRQLVLFNPTSAAASVQINATGYRRTHVAATVGSNGLQIVDLDLLAGPGYHGAYTVNTSGNLASEAVSSAQAVLGSNPSPQWYVAGAPQDLVLTNPARTATTATLRMFGARGLSAANQRIDVPPLGSTSWTAPARWDGKQYAVQVVASAPVVVTDLRGSSSVADPVLHSTWYAVRPGGGKLAVFNPAADSAAVDIRFVGPTTLKSEQLRLAARGSFALDTGRAEAIIVTATHGVALGFRGATPTAAPSGDVVQQVGVTAGGPTTTVDLFNPSTQAAHVSFSVVTSGASRHVTAIVQPSRVFTLQVRKPSDPPGGVLLTSDLPVVAVAR